MQSADCHYTSTGESAFTGTIHYTPELRQPSSSIPDGVDFKVHIKNFFITEKAFVIHAQAFAIEILENKPIKIIQESLTFQNDQQDHNLYLKAGSIRAFEIVDYVIKPPSFVPGSPGTIELSLGLRMNSELEFPSQTI